jgi:hypothetical protein
MTTASYWRPSNKNINRDRKTSTEDDDWGVRPHKDYTMLLTDGERNELRLHLRNNEIIPRRDAPKKAEAEKPFADKQLEMAVEFMKKQVATKAAKKAG